MFNQSVRQKYQVLSATLKFPPKLKGMETPGGLDNVEKWKTKIWLNNSGRDEPEVGYIAIDPKTGMIVPIARCDEHHTGYDLLEYLTRKKLIPKATWFTIWALGDNYVYNEEHAADILPAFKKWREIGGPNLPVKSSCWAKGFHVSMDDFIAAEGKPKTNWKGELAPAGRRIVDAFEKVAQLYAKHHKAGKSISVKPFVNASQTLMRLLDHYLRFVMDTDKRKKAEHALLDLEAKELLEPFETAIFAYDGIKNQLHTELRDVVKNPKGNFHTSYLLDVFGDLKLAKAEFDRLGNI